MKVVVISLNSMLNNEEYSEKQIQDLLLTFSTINISNCNAANDVEVFLHTKAIRFDKSDNARTHLVFDKETTNLLGYFAISPKTWEISFKDYEKLKSVQKKKLGLSKNSTEKKYKINGHLIGQLGLNYNAVCKVVGFTGSDLLEIACNKIREGYNILGGRITWLECVDVPQLISFYEAYGFSSVKDYVSPNGYKVFFKRTKDM